MIGMGMGVGFSSPPPWTPAAVPGCILYGGAYLEARAVRAASPTIPGAGWTGANWAGAGLGPYQHTAGATADLTQAILIAGNRYTTAFAVSGLTAGTVTHKQGTAAGAVRSANGSYTDELTAQATSALWTPSNDFDGAVLVNSIVNRSLTSYTPAFTTIPGSVLAQATATEQPWVSSDGLGVRYQAGDNLVWNAAASNLACLHNGAGATFLLGARPSVIGATKEVFAVTANAIDSGSIGFVLFAEGGSLCARFMNGGAGYSLSLVSAGVEIAVNTRYALALRVSSGVNGVTLWKNGAVVATGTLSAPSAADPNTGLKLGALSSVQATDGIVGHPAVYNRALTDAEIIQASNYILAQATL